MTIEELEKKMAELEKLQAETENAHAELKAQIAELKARNEEPPKPPHPRWKPMNDNAYYYIYSNEVHRTYWCDNYFDMGTYSVGNVFRTEEAAKFAIERLKVLAEMQEWAGEWRSEYNLAWDNDKIIIHASLFYHGELCFATREDAEGCIKAVGEDRIKKYYFMIPEETNND